MQLSIDTLSTPDAIAPEILSNPQGYKRLYGFHKYWGKKPYEPLAFAIEHLTDEGDVVLDPFVGSGTAAREALLRNRRFIGFDINPVAVELTRLLVSPPSYKALQEAAGAVEAKVKDKINHSYRLRDGRIASHYLWDGEDLLQVWLRGGRGRKREELCPTVQDISLIEEYENYRSRHLRSPCFFSNSRINTRPDMSASDILTGRAQHNLDLLIESIEELPQEVRSPMKLCLTSASGQMTKMVFAVTGRGKTTGNRSSKVEVGSWVIGYWRPKLHFEVNVWNCFERRVSKLLNAVKVKDALQGTEFCSSMEGFERNESSCYVECMPCQKGIQNIKKGSVNLILTDPPHSDRIPYLELSELWNGILGTRVGFESEIVVSNARERNKTQDAYNRNMSEVVSTLSDTLRDDGIFLLLYNARQKEPWTFISQIAKEPNGLKYFGNFPCNYSASSVVQDNRKGGLKEDVVLVFGKCRVDTNKLRRLSSVPNWSSGMPC